MATAVNRRVIVRKTVRSSRKGDAARADGYLPATSPPEQAGLKQEFEKS